jgi:hypothetical protein
VTFLDAVGRSLAQGWWMLFETFWALVLGFGLSGAVQAFASRARMQQLLGDHRPATIARAGLLGAFSSSCSYAASALARSLFVRGADFTAAMVFMFASTNLVIELGIVLWRLLGWQFALAEVIGGMIMMALLAVVLPRTLPVGWLTEAREGHSGPGDHVHDHGSAGEVNGRSWRQVARTRAGWSAAAGYTVGDLRMVWRELAIGFLVAGVLAEEVPTGFWRSLFLTGHGFGSALENAALGPFLAVISFVCSIGNVPLAAALWKGGIGFGGVLAFVFADLIAFPLLGMYRRYYGLRVSIRLLAVFWAVMAVAGLATEYLFRDAGLLPHSRPAVIAGTHAGANPTTGLDGLAVVALAAVLVRHYLRTARCEPEPEPRSTAGTDDHG